MALLVDRSWSVADLNVEIVAGVLLRKKRCGRVAFGICHRLHRQVRAAVATRRLLSTAISTEMRALRFSTTRMPSQPRSFAKPFRHRVEHMLTTVQDQKQRPDRVAPLPLGAPSLVPRLREVQLCIDETDLSFDTG